MINSTLKANLELVFVLNLVVVVVVVVVVVGIRQSRMTLAVH